MLTLSRREKSREMAQKFQNFERWLKSSRMSNVRVGFIALGLCLPLGVVFYGWGYYSPCPPRVKKKKKKKKKKKAVRFVCFEQTE